MLNPAPPGCSVGFRFANAATPEPYSASDSSPCAISAHSSPLSGPLIFLVFSFYSSILYAHPIHQSPALPNTMDSGPSAPNESRAPIVRRLMSTKASRFEDCFYVKERADRGRRSSFLYFLWHPRRNRIHTLMYASPGKETESQ